MAINNGGPAYPVVPINSSHWEGMTMRGRIALEVLPTIIELNRENVHISYAGEVAESLKYADELIKQLAETEAG